IDPRSIIEAVRKKNGVDFVQGSLFSRLDENPPIREAIEFYKHKHNWSNRLIAGDSLLVMNSLLEKEGMAGKVQMVYIDPPYGPKGRCSSAGLASRLLGLSDQAEIRNEEDEYGQLQRLSTPSHCTATLRRIPVFQWAGPLTLLHRDKPILTDGRRLGNWSTSSKITPALSLRVYRRFRPIPPASPWEARFRQVADDRLVGGGSVPEGFLFGVNLNHPTRGLKGRILAGARRAQSRIAAQLLSSLLG